MLQKNRMIEKLNAFLIYSLLILLLIITSCSSTQITTRPSTDKLKVISKLAFIIQPEADFTVIHDGAKGLTTLPGIIGSFGGGLVGVFAAEGLTSKHKNSLDKRKQALVNPNIDKISYSKFFVESLLTTLKSSNRFKEIKVFDKEIKPQDSHQYDAVISLCIQDWGIRLTDHRNDQMSVFIELDVKMIQAKNSMTMWEEHQVVLGRSRHSFDFYQNNMAVLQSELMETATDAGTRIANILNK